MRNLKINERYGTIHGDSGGRLKTAGHFNQRLHHKLFRVDSLLFDIGAAIILERQNFIEKVVEESSVSVGNQLLHGAQVLNFMLFFGRHGSFVEKSHHLRKSVMQKLGRLGYSSRQFSLKKGIILTRWLISSGPTSLSSAKNCAAVGTTFDIFCIERYQSLKHEWVLF